MHAGSVSGRHWVTTINASIIMIGELRIISKDTMWTTFVPHFIGGTTLVRVGVVKYDPTLPSCIIMDCDCWG